MSNSNQETKQNFNNRVFGCIIIKSINSNYNADFTHQPRTLPDGTVYATDKALKYTIRNYFNKVYTNEKVFYFRNLDEDLKPRTLDETYKNFFGEMERKASTKKKNIAPDEFSLFYYDGDTIKGIVSGKPSPKEVKDFFSGKEETDPFIEYKTKMETLFKKVATLKFEEAKEFFEKEHKPNEDEEKQECIFYIEEDKKPKMRKLMTIKDDIENLLKVTDEINNLLSGGLDKRLILGNLLTCLDIKLFGATYAGDTSISIHGPTQINYGVNRFSEGFTFTDQIMSPFRNSNEKSKDSSQTTLGSQSKLHEGHYVHHFSINPLNIKDFCDTVNKHKDIEKVGLTVSDIEKLKEGLRKGATYYDSASKAGTENELLLWIELKEDSKAVLPNFTELINISRNQEKKVTIDLDGVAKLLKGNGNEIQKIELYYNKTLTIIVNNIAETTELEL